MAVTLVPGNFLSATTATIDPSASGWRARLNAKLSLGANGSNGPNCLSVQSVAAGEMQAETVAAYSVLPGDVYYTYADAASASQPERIGILWLDAAYAEISTTWSMTTTSASAFFHRVAVAGPAPATAAWARVVASSSPASAGILHFWDNFFFGLPIRTTGNLFDFNTESNEVDASSWTSGTNCTVARQAPNTAWAPTVWTTGGHVIAMTVTAAGAAHMLTTARPVVTPGADYVARAYINPPTTASTSWVELRFYDATGVQIQATRAYLAPPDTSWYRQRVSAVAPAAAATAAVAVGIDSASAGQVVRSDGAVLELAPRLMAGTVVPYADASFEQGAAGWTVATGAATIARSSPWGARSYDGSYSLIVTSATATASTLRSARWAIDPATGLDFRSRIYMMTTAGGWTVAVGYQAFEAGGALIGSTTTSSLSITGGSWQRVDSDWTAPAGTATIQVDYILTATAAGSTAALDAASLWPAQPLIRADAHPETGSVTLTLRELPVGQLISVWRYGADGIRTLVRGPDGLLDWAAITSDLMVIEDYELPLGVPVTYRVEMRPANSTTTTFRTSNTVTVDAGDRNLAWLGDPGQPQRNVQVLVQRGPDWRRPVPQSVYVVRGRRAPVVLSGVRGALEGDLQIWTRSDEERHALHWLLDSGNILLWRPAPGMGVEPMYVAVGQADETRVSGWAPEPWRAWTLPLIQVDMPTTVGVGGTAGRTWRDVLAEFPTWQAVLDAYATWEDVLFDRKIGGV